MSEQPHTRRNFVARLAILRLVIFFLVLALAYAGPQYIISQQILPHVTPDMRDAVSLIGAALTSVLAISLYGVLVGVLERRHIAELAVARGLPLLLIGILLAFAMFSAVYAVLWKMQAASWLGVRGFDYVLPFIAMAVVSGVGEELLFRGCIFRILEDMFGTAMALILSGALFGALHMANPHATFISGAAIALEAGVLLGAAYAATRNLWLPIGLHIGWNFTEGGVFGAAVSGGGDGHGILNIPLQGPELLTGGAFGPEASVVAVAICSTVGLFFVVQTIRRGRWVRASFNMLLD